MNAQYARSTKLRARAFAMLASGHLPIDVCRALGIARSTLTKWRNESVAEGIDPAKSRGNVTPGTYLKTGHGK